MPLKLILRIVKKVCPDMSLLFFNIFAIVQTNYQLYILTWSLKKYIIIVLNLMNSYVLKNNVHFFRLYSSEEEFFKVTDKINRGDIIGCHGHPGSVVVSHTKLYQS